MDIIIQQQQKLGRQTLLDFNKIKQKAMIRNLPIVHHNVHIEDFHVLFNVLLYLIGNYIN